MRILAISDVPGWNKGHLEVVQKEKPDVLVLCGDLTPPGHATNFYTFLKGAGKKTAVLVIAGNHDKAPDYDVRKVNSIDGCREVSAQLIQHAGMNLLGLGYHQSHRLSDLRRLMEQYKGKVDILLSHCEGPRLESLVDFGARLIIQGHFGTGQFFIRETQPIVFIDRALFTIIDVPESKSKPFAIDIAYMKMHHSIDSYIKKPILKPYGTQADHEKTCERCNRRLLWERVGRIESRQLENLAGEGKNHGQPR